MLFAFKQAFRKWLRPKEPKSPTLGSHSTLLLAKLGFDMRPVYKPVLDEPLPHDLQSRVEQLPGAHDRDVIDLRGPSRQSSILEAANENPPR